MRLNGKIVVTEASLERKKKSSKKGGVVIGGGAVVYPTEPEKHDSRVSGKAGGC